MLNIIQIWPPVSEKEVFKVFYIGYIMELATPPGGHVILDIIMNFGNLQEGHLRTIPAKYYLNLASGFKEEDCWNCWHDDDGRRTTDIQEVTKAHPEHSSGELKSYRQKSLWQTYMKWTVDKTATLVSSLFFWKNIHFINKFDRLIQYSSRWQKLAKITMQSAMYRQRYSHSGVKIC